MDEQDDKPNPTRLSSEPRYPGLEQLICVLLADPAFAAQMLANPTATLERSDHDIRLSSDEQALATSITGAADVYDFAALLHAKVQQEQKRPI